jgi:anthranilate synthase component 1
MSALPVQPDRQAFDALAGRWPLVPVWTELLADVSTPVAIFPSLAGGGGYGALLESVERSERWGRYSFVAGEPAASIVVDADGVHVDPGTDELAISSPPRDGTALDGLKSLAEAIRAPRLPELPPLTGGLVGFLAYEGAGLLDETLRLGTPAGPLMRFQLIDRAAVFDHWRQRLLLVAHVSASAGHGAAVRALESMADRIRTARPPAPEPVRPGSAASPPRANLSPERYMAGVRRAKEHIVAGDIFQVVLSRRMSTPVRTGGLPVYRRLRVTNPAPYMFFLRAPGVELAGSSPEPLVRVEGRRVISRPIAGTRPRGRNHEEDLRLELDLRADPKERAEHAMLVDLARNDLGKVCTPGTVRPTELMAVERFTKVMHLVSTVEGELRDGLTALDALAATFPAGTVTGAPKRRAMEIIAEHEPSPRGPYAGAVGYVNFAGDLDFCITIRTVVVADGEAHVQAGAGIVADSDPAAELKETEVKAAGVLAAIDGGLVAGEGGSPEFRDAPPAEAFPR